jgi:ABC-type transporter Mla subunit MlaD
MADSHKDEVDPNRQADGGYPILSQQGTATNRQWRAVAEETGTYLQLLEKLEHTAPDAAGRRQLEEQMVASLSRLATRSSFLCEAVEKTFETATRDGKTTTNKGKGSNQLKQPEEDPFTKSLSQGKAATKQIGALLQTLSIASERMTEEISTYLARLEKESRGKGSVALRRLRSAAHDAATAMTSYTEELARNIPPLRRRVTSISETFTTLSPWLKENQPDKRVVDSLIAPLGELKEPVGESIKSTSAFHDSIAEPKGITRELTRARSRLARMLLSLLELLWEFEVLRIEFLGRLEARAYPLLNRIDRFTNRDRRCAPQFVRACEGQQKTLHHHHLRTMCTDCVCLGTHLFRCEGHASP